MIIYLYNYKKEMNMIKKKLGILTLFIVLLSFGAKAQLVTSMKINEVLVVNETNYVDNYGLRNGWIELYNSSAATVNVGGCYLTNDKNNPKKYRISKGDPLTKIKPSQHALFFADDKTDRGTFHLNFSFDPTKENYVALYDNSGTTLIDEITIPAGQLADVSYGRKMDGSAEWVQLTRVSPNANNQLLESNAKVDNFQKNDSSGIAMTITAMAVTFLGLFFLYIIFKQVGKVSISASKRNAMKAKAGMAGSEAYAESGEEAGEIFAAIATALYEVNEDVHDVENTVLTIQKVTRNYSPWSSKLYGLREIPQK
jgi:Na+-transporting methylmalonyl-CoA/oxaloacetate decarboxylase gamma subunit